MRMTIGFVLLGLTLSLCGCYSSDRPLLNEAEAVMPLPEAMKLVILDAGGITFDANGKMSESDLQKGEGSTYLDPTQKDSPPVSFFPLAGRPDFYIVRQSSPTLSLYFLAMVNGNRASIRSADENGESLLEAKMAEMKAESMGFGAKGPGFKIATEVQLLSGAEFEASVSGKDFYSFLVVPYTIIAPVKEGLPNTDEIYDANKNPSPTYWYIQGNMYAYGTGIEPIDPKKAYEAYQQAADGGIAAAMTRLGQMLEDGSGVPADVAEAIEWYQKAALLGNSDAILALGKLALNGVGITKSSGKALYFLRVAGASGNLDAMKMLADMFDKGDVIPSDREERLFWLVKAAEAGSIEAAEQVKSAIRSGDGTSANPQLAGHWLADNTEQEATSPAPTLLSNVDGREFLAFTQEERQYYMTGLLDMLWSMGDRLASQGFNGDCAEGYAMDNASGTANGLSAAIMDFANANPGGNVTELSINYVYSHCDTRGNFLLRDFYVLNFSGAKVLSDAAYEEFTRGALSGAAQAHVLVSRQQTADCIEHYYEDDDAFDDLMGRTTGYDLDLVTNAMVQQLDVLCP